ncbi:MAG TPA: SEC-C metal-binding domain-containing protein [Hanamia sp.]|nr:SEC-C metal-binding domain-containing protein [Hanamia sp.]
MKPYQEINWYGKDVNDVYDFLYEKLGEEDQYPFFEWLMQHFPNLKIDWIETFEDFKDDLFKDEKIDEILSFTEFCKEHHHADYQQQYGFIERDLCDYYFYKNDFEKLKKRIDFIQQNPVRAIDTLTARLLYQLIYHGKYQTAVSYAEVVWKPVNDSEELMGYAAYPFVNTLYVNQLQKCYEAWKNKAYFDEEQLFEQIVSMGYDNNREGFQEVLNALKEEAIDFPRIKKSIEEKEDGHMLVLNIHFLKYMLNDYGLPFIFSEVIWNFIATTKIFGKLKGIENWFYVDANTMDKHIMERLDSLLFTNHLEVFGKVWGLDFVFKFLHHHQLISIEHYENMLENITYFRNQLIRISSGFLWQMMFVFQWPRTNNYAVDLSEKNLFNDTYGMVETDAVEIVRRYLSIYFIPERVQNELRQAKQEKKIALPFWTEDAPYVKHDQAPGRNDPCPCGSGKKYKKCCMNK